MKQNYNFGVLQNGALVFAPKPITADGARVWTNREDLHRLALFLPITRTECPFREGFYYTESWAEEGEPAFLVQHWAEHAEEAAL